MGDLWYGGMAQPPWLLAMNGDYLELGDEWNCNSLGRASMSLKESQALRKDGIDRHSLWALGTTLSEYGAFSPYIVTCSRTAKLLHFNGAMKPWLADRYGKRGPVCSVPKSKSEHKWDWTRIVTIFCDRLTFVTCADLWSTYITKAESCALQDFDKGWREEEESWREQQGLTDKEKEKAPA